MEQLDEHGQKVWNLEKGVNDFVVSVLHLGEEMDEVAVNVPATSNAQDPKGRTRLPQSRFDVSVREEDDDQDIVTATTQTAGKVHDLALGATAFSRPRKQGDLHGFRLASPRGLQARVA
jgi:hypothetical protein